MKSDLIRIHNIDEVHVKVECPEGISYELREAFTFQVPGFQFTPQYKARLWDGKIRLFNTATNQIYRGLVPHVVKFCETNKYSWEYDNEVYDEEFSLSEAKQFIDSLNLPFSPRDYQVESFVHSIRNRRTLLLSPTSSGKSLIIYLIIRYLLDSDLSKRVLIILPTTSLVSQLTTDFNNYGYDTDSNVHQIYSGKEKNHNLPVTVSTWQSIYKQPKSYFHQFDCVIGDEAHLFKAKSLIDILINTINAKYRIGTTGTLDGSKTNKLVLEGLFGEVHKVITTKELMDNKHIANMNIKCLLLRHSADACKNMKTMSYQDEMKYIIKHPGRNKFIKNLALSLPGNTLVLYQFVEDHGKILYDIIKQDAKERKVFFVNGNTNVDFREEIRRIVETEKDAIIVASYGVFSTGVSIKNLHNVIFSSPSKSRVRNLQSIGRGLRTSQTKTSATLYDIADDLSHGKRMNFTLNHFAERLKIYAEEKFKFKIYKIELKG